MFLLACRETAKAPPATHTIAIRGMQFVPQRVEANVGDTIIWNNEDIVVHSATAEQNQFDSTSIFSGASYRLVLSNRGEIDYGCSFHPTMKATLLVH